MPRGDRSGPMGMGPKTGRAAGFCAGYPVAGYANPLLGRGVFRSGSGGGRAGRGHRNWYHATGLTGWQRAAAGWTPDQPGSTGWYPAPPARMSPAEEAEMIQSQIEMMEENIKAAQERLGQLETNQE